MLIVNREIGVAKFHTLNKLPGSGVMMCFKEIDVLVGSISKYIFVLRSQRTRINGPGKLF